MKKVRSKSLILPISLIVLSLVIIVSTTFAYFTDKQSSNSPVSFGKVEITAGEMETLSTPLRDVIAGSKITDKITFSKAVDSESMYVRAKVYFSTDSTVQAVKNLVDELNGYDLGSLGESSAYGWSDAYNNIHYLVSKTDTSKAYALANNDVITLSNGFSIPTALKQSANLAQYMQKVSFNIEVQAIQSATIDADLDTVDTYFVDIFGGSGIPPYSTGKFTNVSGTAGYTDNTNLVGKYYIEMGSYPQTLYTGSETLGIVTGETYTLEDASGTGEVCQVYEDTAKNKYVKLETTSSNSGFYSETWYAPYQGAHYYKIEPVRWVVIGQADGTALPTGFDIATTTLDQVLVVSEKILTQRIFNPDTAHTTTNGDQAKNDWEGSELNTFMNGAFINDLFTVEEKARIQDTSLVTTYRNTSGTVTQLDSESKMFPLAINSQNDNSYTDTYLADLLNDGNPVVLDSSNWPTYDNMLAKNTDLATAMGVYEDSSTGFGLWLLRSGYYLDDGLACIVLDDGSVYLNFVDGSAVGVRGAFVVAI